MAGLSTHLGIASFGLLIGIFVFKNWKYGLAFFIGHLTPDLIDFGVVGLLTWEFNPSVIMLHDWFRPLAILGHTLWHWIVFGLVVFLILLLLNKFDKLSLKKLKLFSKILLFFLIGIGIHLIIDKLIIETNYWI
jgi:hypothetical protein